MTHAATTLTCSAVLPVRDLGAQRGITAERPLEGLALVRSQRAQHIFASGGAAILGGLQIQHGDRHYLSASRLRRIHDLTEPSGDPSRVAICSWV